MSEKEILIAEFLDPLCGICRERQWSIGVREPAEGTEVKDSGFIMYYCGRCWNMGSVKLRLNDEGNWKYATGSEAANEKPMTEEELEMLEELKRKSRKGDHFD